MVSLEKKRHRKNIFHRRSTCIFSCVSGGLFRSSSTRLFYWQWRAEHNKHRHRPTCTGCEIKAQKTVDTGPNKPITIPTNTRTMKITRPTNKVFLLSKTMRNALLFSYLHDCIIQLNRPTAVIIITVLGQNGSRQNGTDKMVWTKWYTDKKSLDKMVRTQWYGQNGTNKTVPIKSSINLSIPFPLTIWFFHQSRFHLDPFTFPLCA